MKQLINFNFVRRNESENFGRVTCQDQLSRLYILFMCFMIELDINTIFVQFLVSKHIKIALSRTRFVAICLLFSLY